MNWHQLGRACLVLRCFHHQAKGVILTQMMFILDILEFSSKS